MLYIYTNIYIYIYAYTNSVREAGGVANLRLATPLALPPNVRISDGWCFIGGKLQNLANINVSFMGIMGKLTEINGNLLKINENQLKYMKI